MVKGVGIMVLEPSKASGCIDAGTNEGALVVGKANPEDTCTDRGPFDISGGCVRTIEDERGKAPGAFVAGTGAGCVSNTCCCADVRTMDDDRGI